MSAPSAVTTLLFTDIEGSTRLWEQEPKRMSSALVLHDAIARAAVEARGGLVVKMMGDGMLAAFDAPLDAIAATLNLQLALTDSQETFGIALQVRCALHVGVVERRDNDFFGTTVSRAARIMAVAHGGQVLVSQAVAGLVADRLSDGVTLRDLGAVRLRDLASPERVFQLVHRQLRGEFPALRSLEATPNNLAHQITSFVGRQRELADVKTLLRDARLVTLHGVGGLGKTRLSLQVAADVIDEYMDGVWFVELAPIVDARRVPQAVASVMGVKEETGRPVAEALVKFVKDRRLLLILDNCEHVAFACADLVKQLLSAGSQVKILASSRENLRVAGETLYELSPLAAPTPRQRLSPVELMRYEAVRLFVERANAAQSSFQLSEENAGDISEICCRLDGIPLGLELAAARVGALSIEDIARRLTDRFRLLKTGDRTALPRQQTLRAMIDWSHELLTASEQIMFRRLGVFVGGWTLEAAETVCAGGDIGEVDVLDLLIRLVEKSLVMRQPEGGRYRLLETVRAYALERLAAAGELAMIRIRMLNWLLDFFIHADESAWTTPDRTWLADVRPEFANLRSALRDALGDAGACDVAVRLVAAAMLSWLRMGEEEAEPRALVDRALALVVDGTDHAIEARLQFGRGLYYKSIDVHVSMQAFRRALDLAEGELGARDRAHILLEYARALTRAGDLPGAERALLSATNTSSQLSIPMLNGLVSLAWAFLRSLQARPADAREHAENAVIQFDLARAGTLAAMARNDLADHMWASGDLSAAEMLLRQIIATGQDAAATTDRSGVPQMNLASVLAEQGDADQALMIAREAVPLLRLSDRMWSAYDCLSLIAVLCDDYDLAARLHGFSDAGYEKRGIGIREPNEARLHARVARALCEKSDAPSLHRGMVLARTLDDDAACELFLRLGQSADV